MSNAPIPSLSDPSRTMRIGLVYNLRSDVPPDVLNAYSDDYFAELDSDITIDALANAISTAGYEVVRIGAIEHLVRFLAAGHTVDAVFNFAEGLWGSARESQVPGLLDAWRIPYTFADPLTLAICIDKAFSKRIWRAHGLPTADFTVADTEHAVATLLATTPRFPLFVKPVREGSSKGIDAGAIVHTPQALRERVRYVHAHYQQPALVERFLTGAEFTVGVLGAGDDTYALGAAEVKAAAAGGIYGYQEKQPDRDGAELYAPVRDENLRTQLCDLGVRAFRILGARDAGRVDIRLDEDGQPQLLEINPLAGMHPNFSALPTMAHWAGLSYNSLVSIMLNHARRRWLTT